MTNRERFLAVFNGRKPDDRLPMIEWATWWGLTLDRWKGEGLKEDLQGDELFREMGLDVIRQYWLRAWTPDLPSPAYHGAPIMDEGEEGYEALKKYLYPDDANEWAWTGMREGEKDHQSGDVMVWGSLEGGFWFPRRLMGIENHLCSFYD